MPTPSGARAAPTRARARRTALTARPPTRLIWAGVTVFFMQCGFGMLEAGNVRLKNTKNILLKNLLDACMGAIVWWAWGFAAAVKLPLLLPHTNTPPNAQYQTHPRAAYR